MEDKIRQFVLAIDSLADARASLAVEKYRADQGETSAAGDEIERLTNLVVESRERAIAEFRGLVS